MGTSKPYTTIRQAKNTSQWLSSRLGRIATRKYRFVCTESKLNCSKKVEKMNEQVSLVESEKADAIVAVGHGNARFCSGYCTNLLDPKELR